MILCNIIELHWGWPLAAISSVLYFFFFGPSACMATRCCKCFFAVLAMWGWSVWLRGVDGEPLPITRMPSRQRVTLVWMGTLLWLATGGVLLNFTDTDVPWWDAFPTAFSLVGQYLLAHKRLENWAVWIIVYTVPAGLFAWKALWLTTLLYVVFIALSAVGWRTWASRIKVDPA